MRLSVPITKEQNYNIIKKLSILNIPHPYRSKAQLVRDLIEAWLAVCEDGYHADGCECKDEDDEQNG